MCKEAQFKVLSYPLSIETEKNWETCQDSWSLGWDLNVEPPEYKAGVVTTQLLCSVCEHSGVIRIFGKVHLKEISKKTHIFYIIIILKQIYMD
jgi:hypothetical protein